jgi:hypothetical protein
MRMAKVLTEVPLHMAFPRDKIKLIRSATTKSPALS